MSEHTAPKHLHSHTVPFLASLTYTPKPSQTIEMTDLTRHHLIHTQPVPSSPAVTVDPARQGASRPVSRLARKVVTCIHQAPGVTGRIDLHAEYPIDMMLTMDCHTRLARVS